MADETTQVTGEATPQSAETMTIPKTEYEFMKKGHDAIFGHNRILEKERDQLAAKIKELEAIVDKDEGTKQTYQANQELIKLRQEAEEDRRTASALLQKAKIVELSNTLGLDAAEMGAWGCRTEVELNAKAYQAYFEKSKVKQPATPAGVITGNVPGAGIHHLTRDELIKQPLGGKTTEELKQIQQALIEKLKAG